METINFEKKINPERENKEALKRTTVYINAGGQGTRLLPLFPDQERVTKALLEFAGKPMIENHTKLLTELGFKNVIVGAGDHRNIKDLFKNKTSDKTSVVNTEIQEDTAGDMIKAIRESQNVGKNILAENVDTIAYVKNIPELILQHEKSRAAATIVLTTKKGVPNEGAFYMDENNKIVFSGESQEKYILPKPEEWKGFQGSSTGIVILDVNIIRDYEWQPGQGKLSLYKDMLPKLIQEGKVYGYNNGNNMFIDTGTIEKYNQIKRHEDKIFGGLEKRYTNQIKM